MKFKILLINNVIQLHGLLQVGNKGCLGTELQIDAAKRKSRALHIMSAQMKTAGTEREGKQ